MYIKKENTPLVSIILIFLNEERFIEEAIESIFAQTYSNWELLLIDDGSTDRSTLIGQEFSQKYPLKIHYFDHKDHQNKGMSASRNLGIKNAQGKYIGFLDADDIWLPKKLEEQVGILEEYPEAALVCGRTEWWYSWTGKPEDQGQDFLQKFKMSLDQLMEPPRVLLEFLQDEWASLCDILVRRQVVNEVGGYENRFRGMYEDQVFHTKLCLNHPVYVSGNCWYRYRQHNNSCTSKSHNAGQYNQIRKEFVFWLDGYLKKQESGHESIRKVIQPELWRYRNPLLNRISGILKKLIK